MTDKERVGLESTAKALRRGILEIIEHAGSGHIGGSLSSADIVAYLYFHALNFDPKNLKSESRDRLVLSAGHICPVFYAAFEKLGIISHEELLEVGQIGSDLQRHPDRLLTPAFETSSGSLGQGLSIALGMALALKHKGSRSKVVCLMSDAEAEEGSVWEAVMAGAHYNPGNLIAIVDRNGMQIGGTTENTIGLAPLGEKFKAFGWQAIDCDGHSFTSLDSAYQKAITSPKPSVIIARTTMGKGVRSIENDFHWHGKEVDAKTIKKMINEIA